MGNNETLNQLQKKLGFVPNLYAEMAKSKTVLSFYLGATDTLGKGELSAKEQQVVFLTTSVLNDCSYCLAAHGTIALGAGLLSESDIRKIQEGKAPIDAGLALVFECAKEVIIEKGYINRSEYEKKGLSQAQIYEIVALIGVKTVANYLHHISNAPIDVQFKKMAASPKTDANCSNVSCGCNN